MLMVSRADSPPVTSLAMAEADGVVGIAEEAGPGTAPGPEGADEAMAEVGAGAEEAVGVGVAGIGAVGAIGVGAIGVGAVGAVGAVDAVGAGDAVRVGDGAEEAVGEGVAGVGAAGAIGAVGAIGAGAVGAGVALICGTLDIATSIFTCCSFVKCKKDPFNWVILLTPSLYCFWRNPGVQSMNLLFNCNSSFISVLR